MVHAPSRGPWAVRKQTAAVAAFLICFLFCSLTSAAEAPAYNRLFPPGGQLGTTVEVALGGKPGDGIAQFWSHRGQLAGTLSEDRKTVRIQIPDDAVPGVHWIRFYNEAGISDPKPFVVGHIPERAEKEDNNLPDEADRIDALATTLNGVLEKAGDVDVFAIDVPVGSTLVASLLAHRDLASPMDAVLQILNSAGTVVAQNDDDHGNDPQLAYDVVEAGTYYVRVFAFPSAPNSTIRLAGAPTYIYRLTVTHGPFIDHVFPAIVDRRSASAVTVCGWNLQEEHKTVGIAPFEDPQTFFGRDFALHQRVHGVLHASHVESPVSRALSVESSVSGRISEAGEKDVYVVPGVKEEKLRISVRARAIHSLLDPVLIITGPDGKVLSETDDRNGSDRDTEATITVPADGPLSVSVEDRFEDGGFRYFYSISCERPKPTLTAAVGAAEYTLASDDPVDVPVAITRSNGFADRLQISAVRLPSGVAAEPVHSEREGDSAKAVTLKLQRKRDAPAFSGAIQIVCRSEQTGTRTFATVALGGQPAATTDVWLTVLPKEVPAE